MEAVASVEDLDDGEVIGVSVEETEILIAKVDGEIFAIGDICTHQHCHLSDGWLEDQEVVCPCHHAKFDVETGEATRPPANESEPTFDVKVEEGQIYIDV